MSTKKRKYELKERAESQQRTRERIAAAAAGLHEEVGPAATTVAEIARRAGVSRLTVYKHFPDNAALYPACSAHHIAEHPPPDFAPALAENDPVGRVRALLEIVYGEWYPSWQRMLRNLLRDRRIDKALDEFMANNLDRALAGLVEALCEGFAPGPDEAPRLRSLVAVALDFWTWDRLESNGLADREKAELMTEAIAAVAAAPATAP